jgi:hypothetical protein
VENVLRIDSRPGGRYGWSGKIRQVEAMTPKKSVILADDVRETLEARVEAEGGSLDDAANELMREGLSKWQRRIGPRDYVKKMAEAQSDDEAIQIADDAVQEHRAERRGR